MEKVNEYTRDEIRNHFADDHLPCWRIRNNAGLGYDVGEEHHTPEEAAIHEDMEIIDRGDEGRVLAIDGNDLVLICDANGPWACTVGLVID